MLPFLPHEVGVDEVGRGPIAGPVVVAAVCLPDGFDAEGLADSKTLTRLQRELLAERIREFADWAVAVRDAGDIDSMGILGATFAGMSEVMRALAKPGRAAVVDGNILPVDLAMPAISLVKGDNKHAAVAAASILAKVTRDHLMVHQADEECPEYGFAGHKGYAAPTHLAALREHGPCAWHRRSFEPVRTMIEQPCLVFVD